MNYKNIYNSLVIRGKSRTLTGYKERHHIVPRCLGGNDDLSNLVDLTPEEHFVAHQLLVKMYPSNAKLIFATKMLTVSSGNVKRNNKMYGWLKRKFRENTSGDNHVFRKNTEARKNNQTYMRSDKNPGKNQPKGEQHWKFGKPFDTSCFTEVGLKSMADAKRGDKNPNAGVKPWNHPRATDFTKALWKRADEIYNIWIVNDKPSYCKLCGLAMNKKYDWKSDGQLAGPFMNMVKYFRKGWIPTQDTEWNNINEPSTI